MHILCVWMEEITEGVRQLQVDPNAEANRLLTSLQKSLCTLTAFLPGIHHLQYSIAGWWQRLTSSPGHSQILSLSPQLRDKIWEWPGDEARQRPGNKAASKRIWSHSQITSSEE